MLSENPFQFPGGDLRLKVTHNGQHIVGSVSSQAMASACKVWKNFIFPPWAGQPELSVEELDFTEDNSEALLILLRIAHCDFANVPNTVSYTELLNLAVLCDQPDYKNWLFIAWVFGRAKIFEDLAVHLVRTICIDEDGYCTNSEKKPLDEPFPPNIIESICDIRLRAIQQLWAPTYEDFLRYEHRQGPICPYPGTRQNQLDCDAKIHNSCKFVLCMLGLSPQNSRCEIRYSFDDLSARLRGVTIEKHDASHAFCMSYIRTDLCGIPSPVEVVHYEHMKIQRVSLLSESVTDSVQSTIVSLAYRPKVVDPA
ncbi:hypothetical protein IFR05_005950 [Cadophora sp. M221]|nr:hypothetical protein IFR05_005950 [Cadophora sp. M221]